MNYPLWEVPFIGASLVIAGIAIIHVFIAHFAVGAGIFNAITERRAREENDQALLAFVRANSFVLILVSMVLGALTGVGIWFSIGLVQPSGTSALIHIFVWGWAIEWVFFLVEVVAALIYYYGWDRLDGNTHMRVGWIYAGAAWMSLFVINGILSFMLTPGDWIETQSVWDAFFNPTFWSSLLLRTLMALALAGLYTLLMATLYREGPEREWLIRYTAKWIMFPLIAMAPAVVWYITQVPVQAQRWFQGASAPITMFLMLSVLFTVVILAGLFLTALRQPRHVTWVGAMFIMFFGLLATASTEMVREAIRRPYIIWNYMYSNSVRVQDAELVRRTGVLPLARWERVREVTPANYLEAGHAVFRLQCQICHTIRGFNGIELLTGTWREKIIYDFIGHMHETKPFMPPFIGTDDERLALAACIASLHNSKTKTSERPMENHSEDRDQSTS